jgi:hypothetical protein
MQPKSGYKTITSIEITNALFCYEANLITLKALQVYFACFSLVAIREAASRSKKQKQKKGGVVSSYRLKELAKATILPLRVIKKEIASLQSHGLINFCESEILITKEILLGSQDLLECLSGKRSPRRPIPIPRSILRFISRSKKISVTKTLLAYILRGLTISRTGEITGQGSVKCSWISNVMDLSIRSVKGARKELIGLGIITADTGSNQWKLNKTGAYFTVNLSWTLATENKVIHREGSEGTIKSPVAGGSALSAFLEKSRQGVDNFSVPVPEFAPPMAQKCILFAPPYKDKKTSSNEESKNQKTLGVAPKPTGFCKTKKGGEEKPKIYDVKPEDLGNFSRVEELYFQAVKKKLIEPTEAGAINFLAAAVRARSVSGDAPRIFMGILRGKLWKNITQADEDRALLALKRYRAEDPDRFRYQVENKLRYAA